MAKTYPEPVSERFRRLLSLYRKPDGREWGGQDLDSVTLDTVSLPLFDSQGRQYEADTDTFGYIPAQKDIFLNQVNPGVTQEGRIIYSVAPDSEGFTVRAGDLSLFGGEDARIALGF